MPTFSQQVLSGSTDGDPIKVAATSIGSGTAIHTAPASTTTIDKVRLYVTNTDTVARNVTIGWGGSTDPDHLIVDGFSVPPNTPPILLVDNLPIRNSNAIVASGAAANVLLITGDVIRVAA